MNTRKLRGNLLLLLTAAIWGCAIVAQSVAIDAVGPFTFLCTRSLLGGLVLLPVIAVSGRKARNSPRTRNPRKTLTGGILCGAALFAASAFQQVGIQETTAGKAGFITAMYMVLVPVFGLFLGRKAGKRVWVSVIAALAGMYFLCLFGEGSTGIGRGDLLEMVCAVFFAVHILIIDHFTGEADGIRMSCIQFFVCGLISLVFMLALETPSPAQILAAGLPIAYAGILSSGVGYTLQIVAQKDTDPTVASLLMSLESVFSLIAGWIILQQAMSGWELLGCVLMFAAIIWVQLPSRQKST